MPPALQLLLLLLLLLLLFLLIFLLLPSPSPLFFSSSCPELVACTLLLVSSSSISLHNAMKLGSWAATFVETEVHEAALAAGTVVDLVSDDEAPEETGIPTATLAESVTALPRCALPGCDREVWAIRD